MEHSSHPHPLILNQNYIVGEGDVCHSCREQVVSSKSFVYCCMSITGNTDSSITTGAECAEFFLHKSCAELPQHIQIPTKSQKFLNFCYRCIRCQFWMHKSCGDAPTSFQFQFHSKHPLILKFSLPLVYQKFHQYCKLCSILQLIAAYMMVEARNKKGYNGYLFSVPSYNDLKHIYSLAAPVFVTMISKVTFYSLLVYFATSLGIQTIAAHQVMIQVFCMCAVWAEPLSQTAQSFMPELIHGANRNLLRARMLLKSLLIIGALSGTILGSIGTSVPLLFPKAFSPDAEVIMEMHKVLIPFFIALCVTPCTSSLEGTLLAGRDVKYISLSMGVIVAFGTLLLMVLSGRGTGLSGCWWALAAFQWCRFSSALRRLTLPSGILYSDNLMPGNILKHEIA